MNEPGENPITDSDSSILEPITYEKTLILESPIISSITIGDVDPLTLSHEEFDQSPGILFHGAGNEFKYDPTGEFVPFEISDGWNDYGLGFYTTDNRQQAEIYSQIRNYERKEPLVYSFLPYQAQMLDVRSLSNPERNGALPNSFIESWLIFLRTYMENSQNFQQLSQPISEALQDGIKERIASLEEAHNQGLPIFIRRFGLNEGIFNYSESGIIDKQFKDFMTAQGYDGMIYREKGEDMGTNQQDLTGYVFYNPQIVDTWEGWQKRQV